MIIRGQRSFVAACLSRAIEAVAGDVLSGCLGLLFVIAMAAESSVGAFSMFAPDPPC